MWREFFCVITRVCAVVIAHEGRVDNLPVLAAESALDEKKYQSFATFLRDKRSEDQMIEWEPSHQAMQLGDEAAASYDGRDVRFSRLFALWALLSSYQAGMDLSLHRLSKWVSLRYIQALRPA